MFIKELRIKQNLGVRSGVSAKTQQPWKLIDLVVTWKEETNYGEPIEHAVQCRVLNNFNEDLVAALQRAQTPFPGALFFSTSEYNGRVYNEIRLNSKAKQ